MTMVLNVEECIFLLCVGRQGGCRRKDGNRDGLRKMKKGIIGTWEVTGKQEKRKIGIRSLTFSRSSSNSVTVFHLLHNHLMFLFLYLFLFLKKLIYIERFSPFPHCASVKIWPEPLLVCVCVHYM